MFSSHTNTNHRPLLPKRLYLRRSIQITQETPQIIRKINVKNIHLRKIDEMATSLTYTPNQLNQRQTIHKKLLKNVSNLCLATTTGSYWAESLKATKRVKEFIIYTDNIGSKPSNVPSYLKRLSKNVKYISLSIEKYNGRVLLSQFYKIIHTIKRFKSLEYFGRDFLIEEKWKVCEKEAKMMDDYIRRLPQAGTFKYEQFFSDEVGMKDEVAKGKVNSQVTGLCYPILQQSVRPSDELIDYLEREEDPLDLIKTNLMRYEAVGFESGGTIGRQDQIEEELEILKEKIRPFYQFAQFPSLQKLDLVIAEDLYPLGSFLCESFASLKNLTFLQLRVVYRPFGSIFLFKALLELPKLSSLDFNFPSLEDSEMELFCQFLQHQKELKNLKLSLKNRESSIIKQDDGFFKVLKTLNGMQKLKHLSLIFPNCSIFSWSETLGNLRRIDRLQTLEISASNESLDSSLKNVNGLCRFLARQKESIKKLNLTINIGEMFLINQLMRTIADLKGLRELKLDFGEQAYVHEDGDSKENQITEMLKGLENLEHLHLGRGMSECSVEMIKGLKNLKRLRRLNLELMDEIVGSAYERKLGLELIQMQNVRKIVVNADEGFDEDSGNEEGILQVVEEFNKRQSLRCDLMF